MDNLEEYMICTKIYSRFITRGKWGGGVYPELSFVHVSCRSYLTSHLHVYFRCYSKQKKMLFKAFMIVSILSAFDTVSSSKEDSKESKLTSGRYFAPICRRVSTYHS